MFCLEIIYYSFYSYKITLLKKQDIIIKGFVKIKHRYEKTFIKIIQTNIGVICVSSFRELHTYINNLL